MTLHRLLPICALLMTPALVLAAAPGAPGKATPAVAGTGEAVTFYILAAVAALSALGCVLSNNIVRMAACLLGTLGGVALLYFLMGATFLGAIQLIVYAGGTLIVIVFGVMLTARTYGLRLRPRPWELTAAMVVCAALLAGLVAVLTPARWPAAEAEPQSFPVAAIGTELLSTYLVPFELASVLLLAVMIGAAYLAQPAKRVQ